MASSINASTSGAGGVITTADSSGVLNIQTAGNTAVTVDASQNVGIGTASPEAKLEVSFAAATGASDGVRINNTSTGFAYARLINSATSPNNNNWNIECGRGDTRNFAIRDNLVGERMRIDSAGNVGIGATSLTAKLHVVSDGAVTVVMRNNNTETGTASSNSMAFQRSGTTVGLISVTGSNTTYGTSSDYRLKENIVPMIGALATVQALKPVTYKWKIDGSDGQGFIAHELQAVVPDCVTGEKDAVDEEGNIKPQGIDTSFLVATLTAAIQEQQTIINDLTARIETLEAK
jgi:hypothetical protein